MAVEKAKREKYNLHKFLTLRADNFARRSFLNTSYHGLKGTYSSIPRNFEHF